MNKMRCIILLCVLILVFGAGYWFLHVKLAQKTDVKTTSAALPAPADVQQIMISHTGESFTLIRNETAWQLESDPDFPLDSALCDSLRTTLSALYAEREVSGGDQEAFGLENPLCQITAVDADGTEYTYLLGNYNDYNGLYYLSCGGDTVYMLNVDTVSKFLICPYDLIDADEAPDIDEDSVYCLSVQTNSGLWQYTLACTGTADDRLYTVSGSLLNAQTPDTQYPADANTALTLIKDVTLLYLYDCVEYRASDKKTLAKYNLWEPIAQVTILYEQEDGNGGVEQQSFRYDFGARTGDYIYVRMEGSDMIFLAYYNEAAQFLSPDFSLLLDTDTE